MTSRVNFPYEKIIYRFCVQNVINKWLKRFKSPRNRRLSTLSTQFSTLAMRGRLKTTLKVFITDGISTFTNVGFLTSAMYINGFKAETKLRNQVGNEGLPMLKGVNKKVVEVVDIENEYFEKAILFIKAEKQERDDKTIKQRAGDYLHTIKYTPRTALSFSQVAVALVKFGGAAALGAIAANLLIH